jgi:hypothetical protein
VLVPLGCWRLCDVGWARLLLLLLVTVVGGLLRGCWALAPPGAPRVADTLSTA